MLIICTQSAPSEHILDVDVYTCTKLCSLTIPITWNGEKYLRRIYTPEDVVEAIIVLCLTYSQEKVTLNTLKLSYLPVLLYLLAASLWRG